MTTNNNPHTNRNYTNRNYTNRNYTNQNSPHTIALDKGLFSNEIRPNVYSDEARKNLVLATTTAYRPGKDGKMAGDIALRAQLALTMLEKARALDLPVLVVDANSDDGWRAEAKARGALLIDENLEGIPGTHFMGKSRRQVLIAAGNYALDHDKKIIAWLEPEKHPYVENKGIASADGVGTRYETPLIDTATGVLTGEADLVVPRRKDALANYPAQQRFEEITGNMTVMALLDGYLREHNRKEAGYLDQWIGPRTFNRDTLEHFTKYDGTVAGDAHDRWESIFVPVWQLLLDGAAVRGMGVDYEHPLEQSALETGNPAYDLKRVEQLQTIVSACDKFVKSYKTRPA